METINGREVGVWYLVEMKPLKKDAGHSMVRISQRYDHLWRLRKKVECQCGKKFTGWNDRAFYSFIAHQKEM